MLTTSMYQMHLDAGAKMVPFAGYKMPVSYPLGIKKEHLHTRNNAGGQVKNLMFHIWVRLDSQVRV